MYTVVSIRVICVVQNDFFLMGIVTDKNLNNLNLFFFNRFSKLLNICCVYV